MARKFNHKYFFGLYHFNNSSPRAFWDFGTLIGG